GRRGRLRPRLPDPAQAEAEGRALLATFGLPDAVAERCEHRSLEARVLERLWERQEEDAHAGVGLAIVEALVALGEDLRHHPSLPAHGPADPQPDIVVVAAAVEVSPVAVVRRKCVDTG